MLEVCSGATHIRAIVSPYVRPCRRQTAAALRGLLRLGLPPPVAMSWARRYLPPQCVSHTQNPPPNKRQAAAGSLARSALAACRHEALSGSMRLPLWLCQQRQPHRPGSLVLCVARSRPYDMPPSREAGRFVRPCIGPAGMATPTPSGPPHRLTFRAGSIERTTRSMSRIGSTGEPTRHVCRYGCANSVSRAPSARFWFVAVLRGGVLSRRPPLCGPCGYCLRQTPSVPPIDYRPG
jgi:hypothetical protein